MGIRLLLMEVQAGIAVLIVMLARFGMKKLPRIYSYVLWMLVFVRLLFPYSFESRIGLVPSVPEGELRLEEALGMTNLAKQGEPAEGILGGSKDSGSDRANHPAAGAGDTGFGTESVHMPEGEGNRLSGGGEGIGSGVLNSDFNAGTVRLPADEEGTGFHAGLGYLPGGMAGEGSAADRNRGTEDGMRHSPLGKMLLLTIWAAGAAGILAYNGAALIAMNRQLKGSIHLKDNIYVCSRIKIPFTLGAFRPKIYLPVNLKGTEMEYIICHEKVHICRKDYLVKNIAFLLASFHWFNPFVWIAFCLMERDMEMSCDETVVRKMGEGIKKEYSQSLLNFAQGKFPAAVTSMTFGKNSVRQRVVNVLSCKAVPRRAAALGTVIILITAVMMFTVRSDAQGKENRPNTGRQTDSQSDRDRTGGNQLGIGQTGSQADRVILVNEGSGVCDTCGEGALNDYVEEKDVHPIGEKTGIYVEGGMRRSYSQCTHCEIKIYHGGWEGFTRDICHGSAGREAGNQRNGNPQTEDNIILVNVGSGICGDCGEGTTNEYRVERNVHTFGEKTCIHYKYGAEKVEGGMCRSYSQCTHCKVIIYHGDWEGFVCDICYGFG